MRPKDYGPEIKVDNAQVMGKLMDVRQVPSC
jgi:hypothetical protein